MGIGDNYASIWYVLPCARWSTANHHPASHPVEVFSEDLIRRQTEVRGTQLVQAYLVLFEVRGHDQPIVFLAVANLAKVAKV
jgi:hypothetical protein